MKEYIKLMKRFHLGGGIVLLLILSSLLDGIQTYETKALQAVLSDISSKENMILFIAVSVTIPIRLEEAGDTGSAIWIRYHMTEKAIRALHTLHR